MALVGLQALAGLQVTGSGDPEASPEQRYGGPADPRHAKVGEQAAPYPWQSKLGQAGSHGPYGPENQLLGEEGWDYFASGAGNEYQDPTFDHTPSTGAAPFPKGIMSGPIDGVSPDAMARIRQQSAAIHGVRTGAGLKPLHSMMDPQQDHWQEIWDVEKGTSLAVTPPRQMMSSGFMFGTRSREQSMARQNEYGFDATHHHRRVARSPVPGNYLWMRPGSRPMRKSLPGPARPAIGPASPFAGQDLGFNWNPTGAALQTVPSEYVAPPTPQLQTPVISPDYGEAVVEFY